MEIAVAVTAIGTIIFLAHLFAAFFEHSRVPDVLPLVLIGLIIGPITGLATIQHFGEVGPVFANLTLVIILFESGLNMKLTSLRRALGPAAILGFLGYILSVVVVVVTTKYLFKIPDISALILGTILGGTAASVAVPLLKGLNLQERSRTALLLESVLGNVLSIVVTLALMKAVEMDKLAVTMVLRDITASFTMACIVGAIFGYLWSSLLVRIRTLAHTKFTTPAFVCISYGIAEMFGFSGMLAALAFGIVMGNAERLPQSKLSSSTWLRPITLNEDERALFAELVFLLKTFFFVYLGISIESFGMELIYAGSIIVLWLFIARPLVVRLALPTKKTTKEDATIACIMIPRGLAAAVLASIAVSKGIEDAVILQSVAYSVVIVSIAMTALFSFFCERKFALFTKPYSLIFTGYKENPVPTDERENNIPDDFDQVEAESVLHYHEDYHKKSKKTKSESRPKEVASKPKPTADVSPNKNKAEEPKSKTDTAKNTKVEQTNSQPKEEKNKSDNEIKAAETDSIKAKKKPAKKKTNSRRRKKPSVETAAKQKSKESQKESDYKYLVDENSSDKSKETEDSSDKGNKNDKAKDSEKDKVDNQEKKIASVDEQRTTTSTVSLSHSVGPASKETADIITHHAEIEETNGDEEDSSDTVSDEETDKVET